MIKRANGSVVSSELGPRGDQPRLLSFNRKLRHLRGISIRNLCLAGSSRRSRGKTFDDEAIPYTLKSPAKLLAVKEETSLSSSRSFTDLKAHRTANTTTEVKESSSTSTRKGSHGSGSRPRFTLQRVNTSPRQRQQAFKDVIAQRIGNVFFSIHCADLEDPIYISEVMHDVMNPDFRFLDLKNCGSFVTRQEDLDLRIWAQSVHSEQWILLVEMSLSLRYLQYIGKALEDFRHPLPDNAVLFHLSDGIYTSFTDLPVEELGIPAFIPPTGKLLVHLEPTSSFDALMRLSTLDQCVQDSIITRKRLAQDIVKLIEQNKLRASMDDQLAEAHDSHNAVTRAVASERRQVRSVANKLSEMRKILTVRRNAIRDSRQAHERTTTFLGENGKKLDESRETHKQISGAIISQQRRICENLLEIYPIDPIPQQSLAFTIRNMALPNSTFQDVKEDITAAALGYIAHVVYMLSFYLSVPLPYRVHPSLSTSVITDPISLMAGNRSFPLYMKGSVFYRFEYGVFLLNKNIELLASKLGLKILDIRQTLPNLKYVLFVATAGQGELPARKAGGIRGLLMDRETGTPGSSRKPSVDSTGSARTGGLRSIAGPRTKR